MWHHGSHNCFKQWWASAAPGWSSGRCDPSLTCAAFGFPIKSRWKSNVRGDVLPLCIYLKNNRHLKVVRFGHSSWSFSWWCVQIVDIYGHFQEVRQVWRSFRGVFSTHKAKGCTANLSLSRRLLIQRREKLFACQLSTSAFSSFLLSFILLPLSSKFWLVKLFLPVFLFLCTLKHTH